VIGRAIVLFVLLALLAATIWWAAWIWTSIDVEMSVHGWVALILGVTFSIALGCGLMFAVFYSSRHGYDEGSSGEQIRQDRDTGSDEGS
jgi:hypothetical protein